MFCDVQDKIPKGTLVLKGASVAPAKHEKKPFCFEITAPGSKTQMLRANDAEDMKVCVPLRVSSLAS